MTGSYAEKHVRLNRDTLNTPWGFRLQGGKDFKTPLTVQRVFVGSPADCVLQRGDIILAIENNDANHLTHKQAQDIIKHAGGSLGMHVKRGGTGRHLPSAPPPMVPLTFGAPNVGGYRNKPLDLSPTRGSPGGTLGFIPSKPTTNMAKPSTPSFGIDYSHKPMRFGAQPARGPTYPESMLNRLNQSLNQSIYTVGDEGPEYEPHRSVSEIKQAFHGGGAHRPAVYGHPHHTGQTSHQPKKWNRPNQHLGGLPEGLSEPGWTPGQGTQQHRAGWASVKAPGYPLHAPLSPPVNRQPQHHHSPPGHHHSRAEQHAHHQPQRTNMGPPAWAGTLKSSGAPRRWDNAEAQHFSPPQQAHSPVSHSTVAPHQPRVQRLTYGPGDTAPTYSQDSGYQDASDQSNVVHSQYNTPIGLYSRSNAEAALQAQTGGKPGDGTMQISGGQKGENADWKNSELFRMIHAEDDMRKKQSARYADHGPGQEMQYAGYVDHKKQSPSMYALEAQVEDGTVGTAHDAHNAAEDVGCSDF